MRRQYKVGQDFGAAWYRRQYDKLRKDLDLRKLRAVMVTHGCTWSIAAWSKYERGLLGLSLSARNALRTWAGENPLPAPPAQLVGQYAIDVVVQEAEDPRVVILTDEVPKNGPVTQVTRPRRPRKARMGIRYAEKWENVPSV